MKIAQRYEVSRSVVDASSSTRHRVTRRVAEDHCCRVKNSKREKSKSARAVNSQESDVKDELLRRIADLEAASAVGQQQVAKLTAENDSLNKEVGRLKHVTELRSSSMAAPSQPMNNQ